MLVRVKHIRLLRNTRRLMVSSQVSVGVPVWQPRHISRMSMLNTSLLACSSILCRSSRALSASISTVSPLESAPTTTITSINDSSNNAQAIDSKHGENIIMSHCIQLNAEGKHEAVVAEWENLKKYSRKLSLNNDVLKALINSAEQVGKRKLVIGMVDVAKSHCIEFTDVSVFQSYLSACAESGRYHWQKAHAMIDFLVGDDKPKIDISDETLTELFETAVVACSSCGKWRTTLDILRQMKMSAVGLTSKAIMSGMAACCSQPDHASVQAAYSLFLYMHKNNIARDINVYLELMRSLHFCQKFNEIEEVWRSFGGENFELQKNPTPTDQLFALRIDSFFKSDSGTAFEDAMVTFESVCDILLYPKVSARSVYKGLIATQNYEEARRFVERVDGMGPKMKLPKMLLSKHILALCEIGEHEEAATTLLGLRTGLFEQYNDGSISAVPPNLWEIVLLGVLRDQDINLAMKVFNAICDIRRSSSDSAIASDARTYEKRSAESVVYRSMHFIIDLLGRDRRWQQALAVVAQENSINRTVNVHSVLALVKVLIECDQTDRALDQIVRYLFSPLAIQELTKSTLQESTTANNSQSADSEQQSKHSIENGLKPLFAAIHSLGRNQKWDVLSELLQRCHLISRGQYVYQSLYDQELVSLISTNDESSPAVPLPATIFKAEELPASVRQSLTSAMPHLFDSAARFALKVTLGLEHAKSFIHLQRSFGISPNWGCVRSAVELAYSECKWKGCLQLFSIRNHCSGYVKGDEACYNWALHAAGAQRHWALAIELLANLLAEKKQPGPLVFETMIKILLKNNQGPFVIEVLKLMTDRNIPQTRRMYTLIENDKNLSEGLKSNLFIQLAVAKSEASQESSEVRKK